MAVDLTEPRIRVAYEAIVGNEPTNWLLLTYRNTRDTLTLLSSGSGGIREMQASVPPGDIVFGFCREQESDVNGFAMISYIPEEQVSGVRRARALVHSRAVSALFKAHQIVISAKSLDQMTTNVIRYKLGFAPITPVKSLGFVKVFNRRSQSLQDDPPTQERGMSLLSVPETDGQVRRTVSETLVTPSVTVPSLFAPPPSLVRQLQDQDFYDLPPPPTPPKDGKDLPLLKRTMQLMRSSTSTHENTSSNRDAIVLSGATPLSDTMDVISLDLEDDIDSIRSTSPIPPPPIAKTPAQMQAAQSRAKWAAEVVRSQPLDPAERAKRRIEAERMRAVEEQQAVLEEAERQARLKYEREQELRATMDEEERRKAILQMHLKRAAAERLMREQARREEEEERQHALEEKRRADKERRLLEARKVEERLKADRRKAEEAARRVEEARRRAHEERTMKMKDIQRQLGKMSGSNDVLLSGWVSAQTNQLIAWRRRWFQFTGRTLTFYKSPRDTTNALDTIEIAHVRAVREWQEGFEELRSIPTSFAIEFNDGQGPWCMFTDTAEDKDVFVGILIKLASLS